MRKQVKAKDHLTEFLIRGFSLSEASMAVEAIYSCAIEGAKEPSTEEDYDRLAELLKGVRG